MNQTIMHIFAMLGFVGAALSAPGSRCPPIAGNFSINLVNLYPESAVWSPETCKLYLSSAYNCTLVEYDYGSGQSKIISIPGISNSGNFSHAEYHGNGLDYDHSTGKIFYALSSAGAFENTNGDFSNNNLTGANQIWVYDPVKESFSWNVNLRAAQESFLQETGYRTSGFQDMAEDRYGNSFAIGTFGSTIMKIDKTTKQAAVWWSSDNHTDVYALGGNFIHDSTLMVSDAVSGGLISFDLDLEGPQAIYVPLQGLPVDYSPPTADGLFAPTKYAGKIALWSDDYNGTSVYGSKDQWKSAHYLGLISSPTIQEGGYPVATFEIEHRIFVLSEYFQFNLPQKYKDTFPVLDVTEELDQIVSQFFRT